MKFNLKLEIMSEAMKFMQWMYDMKNIYFHDDAQMSKALEKIEKRNKDVDTPSIRCVSRSYGNSIQR